MREVTFEPFPKLARYSRNIFITEKLDGTNAQVIVTEDGVVAAASRTRLITPGKNTDNFGFAQWVEENKFELRELGPGRHFGEWYGKGIQRGYGLDHRRFALFNTARWAGEPTLPKCCTVVPVLYGGPMDEWQIKHTMFNLKVYGSVAAPGFKDPEGIVIYHTASRSLFKKTYEGDAEGKEAAALAACMPA